MFDEAMATMRLWKDEVIVAEIRDFYLNDVIIFEGQPFRLYAQEGGVFNYTWFMCQTYSIWQPPVHTRFWRWLRGTT